MRKYLIIVFTVFLLLLREYSLLPDGKLHLHILDVDQGDSILLVSPSGKQILIDGGPNLSALEHLGKHMPFFDRNIELLVLSHPDADHLTALPEVLRRYHIDSVLWNGGLHGSGRFESFVTELEQQGIPLIQPDPSKDIDIGDGLMLDVIWPTENLIGIQPDDPNNPSVVVRALYKDHSILLTGDIEEEAEEKILATGADIRSDILKAPHHGSKTSSSTGFLLAVDPDLVLISSGRDNQFGHPHQEVLDRYAALGIDVRNTAEEGTISLVFE